MLALSVPVLVYQLTESVGLLGTASVVANLPSFLGSPLGGVWADRYSKRVVLLCALIGQSTLTFGLYRASLDPALTVPLLFTFTALIGFASSVNLSAYQALIADIVPVEQLRPAYKLSAIQFNLSRAIGPAVAGIVLAGWGPSTAFLVNALAHIPLALVLLTIRPRRNPRPDSSTHIFAEIVEASRVCWRHPSLRTALITVSVTAGFGMSVQQLGKGLTERVFHVDDAGLGLLVAAIGASAVVTAILTAISGERFRGSVLVRCGLVVYGLGLGLVAATRNFEIGLIGFGITGFAHVLVNVSVTMAIQAYVPEAYRGRVTSLQLMGIILSMAGGAQLGGLIGDFAGLPLVVAGYGGTLIVFALAGQKWLNGFRSLD